MEDPKIYFIESVISYFLGKDAGIPKADYSGFIKFHCDKLYEVGDISFPTNCAIWTRIFKLPEDYSFSNNIFRRYPEKTIADEITDFIQYSRENFVFPIAVAKIEKERCIIFLERKPVFKTIFKSILIDKNYGRFSTPIFSRKIQIIEQENSDDCPLTTYRAQIVEKVLKNLLKQTTEPQNDKEPLKVKVVDLGPGKKIENEKDRSTIYVKCGLVIDANTTKITNSKKSECIDKRTTEVRLLSMHKYGVRIKDEASFIREINNLGCAAVTTDLLEVKHSSPVKYNQKNKNSNKGGLFLLYNSARLEVIFKKFDKLINNGEYPPVPSVDEINLSLLKEEDEWQIMFGFIFIYPSIIKRSIYQLESGICSIHTLLKFLYQMANVFSIYYSRTKILLPNKEKLMPTIHARITFLKCYRVILNETLAFFNIDPVQCM